MIDFYHTNLLFNFVGLFYLFHKYYTDKKKRMEVATDLLQRHAGEFSIAVVCISHSF